MPKQLSKESNLSSPTTSGEVIISTDVTKSSVNLSNIQNPLQKELPNSSQSLSIFIQPDLSIVKSITDSLNLSLAQNAEQSVLNTHSTNINCLPVSLSTLDNGSLLNIKDEECFTTSEELREDLNKKIPPILLEEDGSNKSINELIEFYLARNFNQDSTSTIPVTVNKEKTPPSDDPKSYLPFKNHPNYAPGKRFNLNGETIGWESDDEVKNPIIKSTMSPVLLNLETTQKVSSPKLLIPSSKKRFKPTSDLNTKVPKKARLPWQPEELAALEEGMTSYGTKWSLILADYGPDGRLDQRLANRSQIQLKDKARTERQARERTGRPLGVFGLACSHT